MDSCRVTGSTDLQIDLEASSPATLLGLARRGAGVAILTASTATGQDGVVSHVLRGASTHARLGVVVRDGWLATATHVLRGHMVDLLA